MRLILALTIAASLAVPGAGHAEGDPAQRESGQRAGTGSSPLAVVDGDVTLGAARESQLRTAGTPGDYQRMLNAVGEHPAEIRPALGSFKVNLGRDAAPLGRLPSDPRSTYGEVGLAIDVGESLSLVPSYRLNWTDKDDTRRDGGVADHALKLGANLKF